MTDYQRIDVSQAGDVTVVRFRDRKILDELSIQALAAELYGLVEQDNHGQLLLNFEHVEFLSSAALGKLISLDKKVKNRQGRLKLANIRPDIYDVFLITKLDKLFDIRETETAALAAFAEP